MAKIVSLSTKEVQYYHDNLERLLVFQSHPQFIAHCKNMILGVEYKGLKDVCVLAYYQSPFQYGMLQETTHDCLVNILYAQRKSKKNELGNLANNFLQLLGLLNSSRLQIDNSRFL